MQLRSLFGGYAAGIALLGLGGSAVFLLLGHVSTDAGSWWITLVYALFTWGALLAAGGGALTVAVLPARQTLPSARWCFYLGALSGVVSTLVLATGLSQSAVRSLLPIVGPSAWLLACGLTGLAAGSIIVAFAAARKLAASAPRRS